MEVDARPGRGNTPTPPLLGAESGRSSPPSTCSICLDPFRNKSFTENCLHQFCFNCLLRWSKIKAECPLCKQPFKNIIHNVRSNDSYDKYEVEEQQPESHLYTLYSRRFRYRTTLTLHPRDNLAVQRLLLGYTSGLYSHLDNVPPPSSSSSSPYSHRAPCSAFRRTVYLQNLWAHPVPDFTGRFRECTPEFYRENPAQITRLVPWLNRELQVVLSDPSQIMYAIRTITDLLVRYRIMSRPFHRAVANIVSISADHFIHEFHNFASSPFDMIGYDRNVSYRAEEPDRHRSFRPESDRVSDNDVLLVVSSPESSDVSVDAPVTVPPRSAPRPSAPREVNALSDPVLIEEVSNSDSENSSDEVVIVQYIKPPQERTPEVVDLIASDSDSVIIEEPERTAPESHRTVQSLNNPVSPKPSTSGLVKLSVKRNPSPSISLSDSDSESDKADSQKAKYFISKLFKRRRCSNGDTAVDNLNAGAGPSGVVFSKFTEPPRNDHVYYERPTGETSNGYMPNYSIEMISAFNLCRSTAPQPSTSQSTPPRKVKSSKKDKNRTRSRRSSHASKKKHKHKSKSKKKHKSKDRSSSHKRSLHKEKYHPRSPTPEAYNDYAKKTTGFWERNEPAQVAPSASCETSKPEKKTLKSVVSLPSSSGSKLFNYSDSSDYSASSDSFCSSDEQ